MKMENFSAFHWLIVIAAVAAVIFVVRRILRLKGSATSPETSKPSLRVDAEIGLTISAEEAEHGATVRARLLTGQEVDVNLPPGLADGQRIRVAAVAKDGGPISLSVLIWVAAAQGPVMSPRDDVVPAESSQRNCGQSSRVTARSSLMTLSVARTSCANRVHFRNMRSRHRSPA